MPDRFTRLRCRLAITLVATVVSSGAVSAADVPPSLVIDGKTEVLTLNGNGAQLYDCRTDSTGKLTWQFREPLATLIQNGKTIGRHFAGPTWELADGSAIVGKMAAQAPGATAKDIAQLKLDVVSHQGDGLLSKVVAVQRLNTQGGVYAGACEQPGAIHVEPYSAVYVFFVNG